MCLRRVSFKQDFGLLSDSQRSLKAIMILVTGGTGLIGSEVLRLLSRAAACARARPQSRRAQALPGITWVQEISRSQRRWLPCSRLHELSC